MPAVARGNSTDAVSTNHLCTGTTTTNACSPNVRANSIGIVRFGDAVTTHTFPPVPICPNHAPTMSAGTSTTVRVNSQPLAYVGSLYGGSENITTGSSNVFSGWCINIHDMANYDASSNNSSKTGNRVFSDLNLDFTRNAVTNDITKIKGVEAVKRSVRNLVNTATYERPFHPELGCGIRELLFENFTPMTKIFLQRKIEEVLINYEPRINLQNVAVDDDQDKNRLVVDIYFYVVGVPGPQQVQTFLQRVR